MPNITNSVLEIIRLTHEEGRIAEKLDVIHRAKVLAHEQELIVTEEYYQNQIALAEARRSASSLYDHRGAK